MSGDLWNGILLSRMSAVDLLPSSPSNHTLLLKPAGLRKSDQFLLSHIKAHNPPFFVRRVGKGSIPIMGDYWVPADSTEVRTLPLVRNSWWLWLKSHQELSPNQLANMERLSLLDSKTEEAHHIKLTLQRLFLKKWYFWATHSRVEPDIAAAKTIKRHWKEVLQFVTSRITVEGLNSKIKTAMKMAYGFKSFEYLLPRDLPRGREDQHQVTHSIVKKLLCYSLKSLRFETMFFIFRDDTRAEEFSQTSAAESLDGEKDPGACVPLYLGPVNEALDEKEA